MTEATPYGRFKWTLLEAAPGIHNAGGAYYWAKLVWPEQAASEADTAVKQALLDLLDEGFIFFYWGGWDDGCSLDPVSAPRASRNDVETDLARGGDAPPTPQTVWFTTTEKGIEKLDSLPPEVFLGYERKQEIERVRRDHPDFFERRDQYFRDLERWVETAKGPKPTAPEWPGSS